MRHDTHGAHGTRQNYNWNAFEAPARQCRGEESTGTNSTIKYGISLHVYYKILNISMLQV